MARRILLAAATATALAASVATAQAPRLSPGSGGGQWSGEYTCSQGLTGMTVEMRPLRGDTVDATIIFFAHPRNPDVPSGCYSARGVIDRTTGRVTLRPDAWIERPGDNWNMTTLDGRIDSEGGFSGRVVAPGNPSACADFTLRRNAWPFKPAPARCVAEAPMS